MKIRRAQPKSAPTPAGRSAARPMKKAPLTRAKRVVVAKGAPVMRDIVDRAMRAPRGQVVGEPPLWAHGVRLGGGITPQQITAVMREADAGYPARLVDLANECRQRDCHLQAVLASLELSLAGLGWQIVPPTDARAKDKRAAKWVEKVLRSLAGLPLLIAHLAGAIFHGYAVVEILWGKKDGKLVPTGFVFVAPRRFKFDPQNGTLLLSDDGEERVDLAKEHPNKFVFSMPRVNGDVRPREGLQRPLVWMSVMRNWTIADWLKTGEMSWKPWRIGIYKKTSDSKDRNDLETVMRRMTTDLSCVIPDTTDMKIEWPGGRGAVGSTHELLVKCLAGEMSKATLGQTETTESSSSSGYAQAKVHDNVRRDILEARAKQIASDITLHLIGAMVRLNFGPDVVVPCFEFQTKDEIDLDAFSKALLTLRDAGMEIPVAWAHDRAGIPEPKEGESVLGKGKNRGNVPDPALAPPTDPNQPSPPGGGGAKPAPKPDDGKKPEPKPEPDNANDKPDTAEEEAA